MIIHQDSNVILGRLSFTNDSEGISPISLSLIGHVITQPRDLKLRIVFNQASMFTVKKITANPFFSKSE